MARLIAWLKLIILMIEVMDRSIQLYQLLNP